MSVITTIRKNTAKNLAEYICNTYKTDEFEIIGEDANNFHVEMYKGKVVMVWQVNLAFHDDYRPGTSGTIFDDGVVKKFEVSTEYYKDTFQDSIKFDADDETMKSYRDKLEHDQRVHTIKNRLKLRKKFKYDAKKIDPEVMYHKMQEIFNLYGETRYNECVKLVVGFKNERLRSKFRISIASQIYHWILDPAPKFKKPLSPNQEKALEPYKPS